MSEDTKNLELRAGHWHYNRRVPTRFALFDERKRVRVSLRTKSLETARERRNALMEADDLYWASVSGIDDDAVGVDGAARQRAIAMRRYQSAGMRALARGFTYVPAAELAELDDLEQIASRVRSVDVKDTGQRSEAERIEAEALLGGIEAPPITVSDAFDLYCAEIAIDETAGKSEDQIARWKKTKKRGVQYFIELCGDLEMRSITRRDGMQYYKWWKDRVFPDKGRKPLSANTANRDIGNMRILYDRYFKHIGEEDRQNPFRSLSFKHKKSEITDVPPFETKWIIEQVLKPGALSPIIGDAHLLAFLLIETGCRPGEIANLLPEDIHLEEDVPYIAIRPKKNRELKTPWSRRDIPLVGIALEAMKKAPNGFPHYRDKPDLVSANLKRHFVNRGLLPTEDHQIYSFRHSFEKRMLEAELDYGFRCTIMGHRNTRPAYGDGGSMAYRRDQLLKIALPFDQGVV